MPLLRPSYPFFVEFQLLMYMMNCSGGTPKLFGGDSRTVYSRRAACRSVRRRFSTTAGVVGVHPRKVFRTSCCKKFENLQSALVTF